MKVVAVMAGGLLGTVLRHVLELVLVDSDKSSFLVIMFANWGGSLILGCLYGMAEHSVKIRAGIRLGLSAGLIGAFTTFSTFSVQSAVLVQRGMLLEAILYVGLSVVGGLGFAYVGANLPRWGKKRLS